MLSCLKIEVFALVAVYTKVMAGAEFTQTLSLPGDKARAIELHSSNGRCVYKPKFMGDQHYRLIPSTVNNLEIAVKSFTPDQ